MRRKARSCTVTARGSEVGGRAQVVAWMSWAPGRMDSARGSPRRFQDSYRAARGRWDERIGMGGRPISRGDGAAWWRAVIPATGTCRARRARDSSTM